MFIPLFLSFLTVLFLSGFLWLFTLREPYPLPLHRKLRSCIQLLILLTAVIYVLHWYFCLIFSNFSPDGPGVEIHVGRNYSILFALLGGVPGLCFMLLSATIILILLYAGTLAKRAHRKSLQLATSVAVQLAAALAAANILMMLFFYRHTYATRSLYESANMVFYISILIYFVFLTVLSVWYMLVLKHYAAIATNDLDRIGRAAMYPERKTTRFAALEKLMADLKRSISYLLR